MAGDSPNNKLSSLEPYLEPFCCGKQQISAASRDRETIGHKAKYESFDWALCCEQSVYIAQLNGDVCWTRNAQGPRFSLMWTWTSCLCHWTNSHLSLKKPPAIYDLKDLMSCDTCAVKAPCPTQYDQKKGSCGASQGRFHGRTWWCIHDITTKTASWRHVIYMYQPNRLQGAFFLQEAKFNGDEGIKWSPDSTPATFLGFEQRNLVSEKKSNTKPGMLCMILSMIRCDSESLAPLYHGQSF